MSVTEHDRPAAPVVPLGTPRGHPRRRAVQDRPAPGRGSDHGQLRAQPPVHARRAAADRDAGRRGRGRPGRRHRLRPHRLREELRAEDLLEGHPLCPADGLPGLLRQRAGLRACRREADPDRGARAGAVDPHPVRRAQPHPLAPDLPGHVGHRAGRHVGVLLLHCASATPCSTCSRWSPACACTTATRSSVAWPRTCPRASTPSARSSCETCPRRSTPTSTCWPRTRSGRAGYKGIGTIDADTAIAMGLSGPNLRASGADYDLRRNDPYLAYDKLDFEVITARARRRLRPLPVPHQGDVRVGQDHRPVPREDAVRPGDGDRPQVRAAAAGTSCIPRWSR